MTIAIKYYGLIDSLIRYFLYIIGFLGMWLLIGDSIISFISSIGERKRIYNKVSFKKLRRLIATVSGNENKFNSFLVLTLSIFIFSFILTFKKFAILNVIILSIFFSCIPYIWLRVKLYLIRVDNSYEGKAIITEFKNQYKINYYNTLEALDKMLPRIDNNQYIQKAIMIMTLKIKTYKTKLKPKEKMSQFIFSIDTEWSRMLANNLELAIKTDINIEYGLEDILQEIHKAEQAQELYKRKSYEGQALALVIAPLMYLFTPIVAIKLLDFSIKDFFYYQFQTEIGLKWLLILVIVSIFNVFIALMIKKRKFNINY